jgi:penicillin-binding protein 1A
MNDAERYFPNHKLERDIGLAEYQVAAGRLAAEDQAVNWAKNSSIIIASIVSFASFKASGYQADLSNLGLTEPVFKFAVLAIISAFSYLSIIHIAGLQKSRTLAERKIIVLRRMLGVSYGQNTLVLPNWRIEGADNPFSIHLFTGFLSSKSIPIHVILVSLTASTFFLSSPIADWINTLSPSLPLSGSEVVTTLCIALYTVGLLIFRYNSRDTHENSLLSMARIFAWLTRTPLVKNFENVLYRIRLDIEEARRIRSNFIDITELSIFIEDRNFSKHRGISFKGLARALWGKISRRNLGGGSTITQQFSRSMFISKLTPTLTRKLTEMFLAIWIETVWAKSEILNGYLVTARFDRGVFGFHRACRHFFEKPPEDISKAEAFFLIERLGNIRGFFLGRRVLQILDTAISNNVIDVATCNQILDLYEMQIKLEHLKYRETDLDVPEVRASIQAQGS